MYERSERLLTTNLYQGVNYMYNNSLTTEDCMIIRELAKKQLSYSQLPIMEERTLQWCKHNDLKGEKPMIHVEIATFLNEVMPTLKCKTEVGKKIEMTFYANFLNHELINDDKVVPPYYPVHWDTWFKLFGVSIEQKHVLDSKGGDLGHSFNHIIEDLENDFPKLGLTKYGVNKDQTIAFKELLENIFGDILPVKLVGSALYAVPTQQIVHMMGMEKMLFAMYDCPDAFHELMKRVTDDYLDFFKWQEKEGLLLPTTRYEGVAQGTFAYTNDLPEKLDSPETLTTNNLWGFMDSQETVGISPHMYREFIFPYYRKISDQYGLLSYGCCEPVHPIWDDCLSTCKNIRKVSISPWCNEQMMGEKLRGSKVIFQRKPNPNFIGVGNKLDEDAWREHILKTLEAAKGCHLEITQRDIYTLNGNKEKTRRAVQIIRELITDHWK